MRTWTRVLSVLVVVALAGWVYAEEEGKAKAPKPLRGAVVKVDGSNLILKVGRAESAKEVTVATNADTKITIDGQPAALADIKSGQRAAVMPAEGVAQKIEITTPKPKAEGAPKKKGDAAPKKAGAAH